MGVVEAEIDRLVAAANQKYGDDLDTFSKWRDADPEDYREFQRLAALHELNVKMHATHFDSRDSRELQQRSRIANSICELNGGMPAECQFAWMLVKVVERFRWSLGEAEAFIDDLDKVEAFLGEQIKTQLAAQRVPKMMSPTPAAAAISDANSFGSHEASAATLNSDAKKRRGGRKPLWKDLAELIDSPAMQDKSDVQIANAYRKKFSRRKKRPTAKTVARVRYDWKKRVGK